MNDVQTFRGALAHPGFFSSALPWRGIHRAALFIALWLLAAHALGKGVYQDPADFVRENFAGTPPAPQALWLTDELQQEIEPILGHPYRALRLRYWAEGARSVWLLEEIGKEQPITTGIVIEDGRIARLRVLIFRESRGDEVRHPFFTDQFTGARLSAEGQLDRPIDGVSGATLSTRALGKLARVALLLDRRRKAEADGPP